MRVRRSALTVVVVTPRDNRIDRRDCRRMKATASDFHTRTRTAICDGLQPVWTTVSAKNLLRWNSALKVGVETPSDNNASVRGFTFYSSCVISTSRNL